MINIRPSNANTQIAKLFAIIAACGLMVLAGCQNPTQPPNVAENQTGTLSLTIGTQGIGRTIMPEIGDGSFYKVKLWFVDGDDAENYLPYKIWEGKPITLAAGTTWNLRATAYLNDEAGDPQKAAQSIQYTGIVVTPGASNPEPLAVTLRPIAEGQGTFRWSIGLPKGVTGAEMKIQRIDWDGAGNEVAGEIKFDEEFDLDDPGVLCENERLAGFYPLPSGTYRVFLTLTKGSETATVSAVLHVWQNMDSVFNETFTYRIFPVTLFAHFLRAWNAEDSRWEFDRNDIGIQPGDFYHFWEIEGVDDFDDDDETGIIRWFNKLTYNDGNPILPGNPDDLKTLVDAALIGIGANAAFRVAGAHPSRAALEEAVEDFVLNDTYPIGFSWPACNTVTVTAGIYTVTITLGGAGLHDWGEWNVTTPATCTQAGSRTRHCRQTGCDHSETETIPATGHNWGEWTLAGNEKERSCQNQGCDETITRRRFQVSAGQNHTAVIIEDGSLWIWGGNAYGQLGLGRTGQAFNLPHQVQPGTTWAYVSAGESHTMAIREDGSLWAWGNRENGRLGQGAVTGVQNTPIRVGTLNTWATVSAGSQHTMATRTDGSLWAWGNRENGRLGHSGLPEQTIGNQVTPVRVGILNTWATVSAGSQHTVATRTDGSLWAWGNRENGRIGQGAATGAQNVPIRVGNLNIWASASAGESHTLAVQTNGTLWAWGNRAIGRIGQGSITGNQETPIQVGTESTWADVSAGSSHSVAFRTDGTLWAWGSRANGRIGQGAATGAQNTPIRVGILSITWVYMSAGGSHTVAIRTDGTLWAWGNNASGSLGDGGGAEQATPINITPLSWTQPTANNWAYVSAGQSHTMAIGQDGSLWAYRQSRSSSDPTIKSYHGIFLSSSSSADFFQIFLI